jgi:hypothetical protein
MQASIATCSMTISTPMPATACAHTSAISASVGANIDATISMFGRHRCPR